MITTTSSFVFAYSSYYEAVRDSIKVGTSILEVGGGAHPSIEDRSTLKYTIVDPDKVELKKVPSDIKTINRRVQDLDLEQKYDLIISKMVLEHVENPDGFHETVKNLLSDGGKAVHFFACKNSMPAFVNRFLPESTGGLLLKLLKNRALTESPKYEAYYKRTKGHTNDQLAYFVKLGYKIEKYNSYVGHTYLAKIPVLRNVEQAYTWILAKLKVNFLSTVALVVLSKRDETS